MQDRDIYVSEPPSPDWPTNVEGAKQLRTTAEIAGVMGGGGEPSDSSEQEATPSPGRHNLRSGKQPLREAAASKKKRKAATPPRRDGGINIMDSLPRKHWSYISGPESDDDEQEDRETLTSRAAQKAASARPPQATKGSARSAEQRRSPGEQPHGPADQSGEAVSEPGREAQAGENASAGAETL